MIGTMLTIGAGVYAGLYLASKGCTYRAAMKPLQEASNMIREKCGCKSVEHEETCEHENTTPTNECCQQEKNNESN